MSRSPATSTAPPGRPVTTAPARADAAAGAAPARACRSPRSRRLVRDPYEIYARHVLGLQPLDPLGMAPDYAAASGQPDPRRARQLRRGMDRALRRRRPSAAPRDRPSALAEIADFPDTHAVWEIRFEAMATLDRRLGGEALARDRRSAMPRSPASWSSPRPPVRSCSAAAPTASTSATTAGSRCSTSRPARRTSARQVLLGLAPQLGAGGRDGAGRRLRRGLRRPAASRDLALAGASARSAAANPSATPSRRD